MGRQAETQIRQLNVVVHMGHANSPRPKESAGMLHEGAVVKANLVGRTFEGLGLEVLSSSPDFPGTRDV